MPDRFDLYERCVQSPDELVPLLRAIHGANPRTLGEDFAGTAALSRHWVECIRDGRAIAVDHDAEVIARTPAHAAVTLHHADVRAIDAPVDVLYVGNFSIGEWHTRADLVAYLEHARGRLAPHGCFVCDLYGGANAWETGETHIDWPLDDGGTVIYIWEQRAIDPGTSRVQNVIHFDGVHPIADAFTYDWRLWGLAELRDAMHDAGFATTTIYPRRPDALDDDGVAYVLPLDDPDALDAESFDVLVTARP